MWNYTQIHVQFQYRKKMIVCYYQCHKLSNTVKHYFLACHLSSHAQLMTTHNSVMWISISYSCAIDTDTIEKHSTSTDTNTNTDTCIGGLLFSTNLNICCLIVLFSNSMAFLLATCITLVTIEKEFIINIIIIIIMMIECT